MRFLSKKDVRQKVGLSDATIDRKENDKVFPIRVRIGFRVFWVEEEIEDWMELQLANRQSH
jgi:prophage regulatory protein